MYWYQLQGYIFETMLEDEQADVQSSKRLTIHMYIVLQAVAKSSVKQVIVRIPKMVATSKGSKHFLVKGECGCPTTELLGIWLEPSNLYDYPLKDFNEFYTEFLNKIPTVAHDNIPSNIGPSHVGIESN